MKNTIYIVFFLALTFQVHALTCDLNSNPNLTNLEKILAVDIGDEEPVFDPLFCIGMDKCEIEADKEYKEPFTTSCENTKSRLSMVRGLLKRRKIGDCGLTPSEIIAISHYTGSGYACMNRFLRGKFKNNAVQKVIDTLNSGLAKLPSYQAFVARGAELPQAVRDQHVEGKVVTYNAFTSTSTNRGFGGSDKFIILSKTGKPIMGFSNYDNENEVLFQSNSKFKILKVIKSSESAGELDGMDYVNLYVMKEVISDNKNPEEEAKEDERYLKLFQEMKKDKKYLDKKNIWQCPEKPEVIPKIIFR